MSYTFPTITVSDEAALMIDEVIQNYQGATRDEKLETYVMHNLAGGAIGIRGSVIENQYVDTINDQLTASRTEIIAAFGLSL